MIKLGSFWRYPRNIYPKSVDAKLWGSWGASALSLFVSKSVFRAFQNNLVPLRRTPRKNVLYLLMGKNSTGFLLHKSISICERMSRRRLHAEWFYITDVARSVENAPKLIPRLPQFVFMLTHTYSRNYLITTEACLNIYKEIGK